VKRAILSLIIITSAMWGQIAWGQITQSHPEFCGLANGANPPLPDLSATIDGDGHAVLYLGRTSTGINLTGGSVIEIAEVCPLSDGRLAIFADYGATQVFIIDAAKKALVDTFAAYDPVLSPNQRWIAFKKIYPLHGVDGSDQYMLYDLAKPAAENRPDGNAKDKTDVGMVIFPPGHANYPGSNIDLPESLHHNGGLRIYWAPDSRAIAFEDHTEAGPGIALVMLDSKGTPSAFRHALSPVEICGRDATNTDSIDWRLTGADFALGGARGGIALNIDASGGEGCVPHTLQLEKAAFPEAKTESNPPPTFTRGVIKNGRVVIPPKEEQQKPKEKQQK
jgi:hypothetical protein